MPLITSQLTQKWSNSNTITSQQPHDVKINDSLSFCLSRNATPVSEKIRIPCYLTSISSYPPPFMKPLLHKEAQKNSSMPPNRNLEKSVKIAAKGLPFSKVLFFYDHKENGKPTRLHNPNKPQFNPTIG